MLIDFKYVQNEQKSFLEHLEHKKGIKYQESNFDVPKWLVLALGTELMEIVNESKIHKWWDNSPIDSKKLKEELADFLSHMGNLANLLEVDLIGGVEEIQQTSIESQVIQIMYRLTTLPWKKRFARNTLINKLVPAYVQLVYSFGFDLEDIEDAYKNKMKLNYSRF